MLIELESEDWAQAFVYARQAFTPGPKSYPFGGFVREDVKQIIGISEDVENWLLLGELWSGDFFFLEANHDGCGWDCVTEGNAYRSSCLDDLTHWLTDQQKKLLGISYAKCQNCGYLSTMANV